MSKMTQELNLKHVTEAEAEAFEKRLEALMPENPPTTLEAYIASLKGILAVMQEILDLENSRKG